MNIHTLITKAGFCLAGLLILFASAGCADLQGAIEQATSWKKNAQSVQQDLQVRVDDLQAQKAMYPSGSAESTLIESTIMNTQAKIAALKATIHQADLVIEEASKPSDSVTLAIDSISPWIPAPAQGPMVLGAALIATLIRSRNLKVASESIIRSIDHTMKRDPEFKQRFEVHADSIRSIQTPQARKLIDSAARKQSMKQLF